MSAFQHFIQHKFLLKVLKWLIMLVAYAYLMVVLIRFEHYNELWDSFKHFSLQKFGWIMLVLALLPANIALEAMKWKAIVARTEKLSLVVSLKAVLAGFSTGFFTPNRVGELVGRIAFLSAGNRKVGVLYVLLNSLSQNIVLICFGLVSAYFYFLTTHHQLGFDQQVYLLILILVLLLLLGIYFTLPHWAGTKVWKRFLPFAQEIENFSFLNLASIFGYSFLRYLVFCVQLFAMLHFFSVHLDLWQAVLSIPTSYLLITFTPSIAMSEAAIRSSVAVLVIGVFSTNLGGIALAGICLWLLNFGIPVLVGATVLVRKKPSDLVLKEST